ncbi:MAG: cytidine deaminase [Spirochaetales bacterium]|nr:cytidine deaminase [Spirochaetales bacterium]
MKKLLKKAIDVRNNAYTPYSNFKVGALVIDENNNEYVGVNVENGSFGLTNCAERTAIFSGITSGMKKINVLVVVANTTEPVSPCGACRQVMSEFSDEKTIIILGNTNMDYKVMDINEILPYRFKL